MFEKLKNIAKSYLRVEPFGHENSLQDNKTGCNLVLGLSTVLYIKRLFPYPLLLEKRHRATFLKITLKGLCRKMNIF